MVRLNGSVDFSRSPHVSPVSLPNHLEDFAGQRCHVSGWRKNSSKGGTYQNVLNEVQLPIVNNSQCQSMLRETNLGRFFRLDEGFLCAGGEEGEDACDVVTWRGDGGGPLVCKINGISKLAGIVSWGMRRNGLRDVPGVYVKVSNYVKWVQDQLLQSN